MTLIDGAKRFNYSFIEHFMDGSVWVEAARQNAIKVVSIKEFDISNPGLAIISHNKLLAVCPVCNGAEYVWRDGPYLMLCATCGNSDVGGKFRLVLMPEDLDAIEQILNLRPNPENRNWFPHETQETLTQENEDNI